MEVLNMFTNLERIIDEIEKELNEIERQLKKIRTNRSEKK